MPSFEEFKQRTGETAEYIAAKSIELAKAAAEKTRLLARISKLNADIITEKDAMRRAYINLGKLYYENYKDGPDDIMVNDCERISTAIAMIADCKAEIEECKAEFRCSADGETADEKPAEHCCCEDEKED